MGNVLDHQSAAPYRFAAQGVSCIRSGFVRARREKAGTAAATNSTSACSLHGDKTQTAQRIQEGKEREPLAGPDFSGNKCDRLRSSGSQPKEHKRRRRRQLSRNTTRNHVQSANPLLIFVFTLGNKKKAPAARL